MSILEWLPRSDAFIRPGVAAPEDGPEDGRTPRLQPVGAIFGIGEEPAPFQAAPGHAPARSMRNGLAWLFLFVNAAMGLPLSVWVKGGYAPAR